MVKQSPQNSAVSTTQMMGFFQMSPTKAETE